MNPACRAVASACLLSTFLLAARADAQSFSIPTNVNVGVGIAPNTVTGAEAADLDGDGNGDIVAVDNAANGNIGVARGLGGGVYSVPILSGPTGAITGASIPVTADFDLDGVLDLAYSGLSAGNVPTLFVARGDPANPGAFIMPAQALVVGAAGASVTGTRTTDFTANGTQDLVATVNGTTRRIVNVENGGGFVFGPLTSTNTTSGPQDIDVCVDFNKDGFKDLAIVESGPLGNFVTVYPGTGNPSAPLGQARQLSFPTNVTPLDVHWIDCDQDQFYDLAVSADGGQNLVFLVKNFPGVAGQFIPASVLPPFVLGSVPNSLMRLDVDADGTEDLSVLGVGNVGGNPVTVGFLKVSNCLAGSPTALNAGSVSPTTVPQEVGQYLTVQDQNFDGRLDVLSVDQTGTVDAVKVFTNTLPMALTVTPVRPLLGETTPFTFRVQAGPAFAGRAFAILFSIKGTQPGLSLGGPLELPLNAPVLPFLITGNLGPGGIQTITTPPVTFAAKPVGFSLEMWCAAVVEGPTSGIAGFVTNPALITIP
jgi:hypothetical protein